jgi:hypothetical protein
VEKEEFTATGMTRKTITLFGALFLLHMKLEYADGPSLAHD